MTWVDYVIIGIIILSALVGLLRGFVRETLSLIAWVLAIWVALSFAQPVADWLIGHIAEPSLRLMAAFTALFLVTLLLAAVVNYLIIRLVSKVPLGGTDNVLGLLFGIARGVALIAILVLLAAATPLPRDSWWKEAALIGEFQAIAVWLRGYLPPDYSRHFAYDVTDDLVGGVGPGSTSVVGSP